MCNRRVVWFVLMVLGGLALTSADRWGAPNAQAAPTKTKASTPVSKPDIAFLQGDEARKRMQGSKSEPYYDGLQTLEILAKTGGAAGNEGDLAAQREACRKVFVESVMDFTEDEKKMLTLVVEKLHGIFVKQYPLLGKTPWRFVKVGPKADFGLPHTRGDAIVMPQMVLGRLLSLHKKPRGGFNTFMAVGGLLTHEQLHVVQRRYPKLFRDLYASLWGFRHSDAIQPNEWLTTHQATNPDAPDVNWVFPLEDEETGFRRWIWPRIILINKEPNVRAMRPVAIQLRRIKDGFKVVTDKNGKPIYEDINRLTAYTRNFANVGSVYHPNEISASLFSRIVVFDHLLPAGMISQSGRRSMDKRYAPARTWFRENLKR